jgi:hypothetical protein
MMLTHKKIEGLRASIHQKNRTTIISFNNNSNIYRGTEKW